MKLILMKIWKVLTWKVDLNQKFRKVVDLLSWVEILKMIWIVIQKIYLDSQTYQKNMNFANILVVLDTITRL